MHHRRLPILIIPIGLICIVCLAIFIREPTHPEPVYRGITLSAWLRSLNSDHYLRPAAAVTAVREIGTSALPSLLRKLSYKDPAWIKILDCGISKISFNRLHLGKEMSECVEALNGFEALGPLASPAVPSLTTMLSNPLFAFDAALALGSIGSDAVPALIQGLQSSNAAARSSAALALGTISRKDKTAGSEAMIKKVAELLQDTDPEVRVAAAKALGNSDLPGITVPALIESLSDSSCRVRWISARSLGCYGTNAMTAVPALEIARLDTEAMVRSTASAAIQQILESSK